MLIYEKKMDSFKDNFLAEFGRAFVPKKVRPHIRLYMSKAGYSDVPYSFLGGLFFLSLVLTYFPFMAYVMKTATSLSNPLLAGVLAFFGWAGIQLAIIFFIMVCYYFYLDLKIFNRTNKMEAVLADYLMLVSTNLRGGMSFEQSLWSAIQPEFSYLSNEIELTSKKVMTGYDIEVALKEFSDKYDSPILKRTLGLIIGEIKAGGKIADLIDKIIKDLKDTKELKQDMEASVVSYMIFIGAIVVVISPGLFALSYNLLSVITGFASKISTISSSGGTSFIPINSSGGTLNTGAFKTFSRFAISLISLFSSMIVSILEKGTIRGGVKYIPIFIIIALILYEFFLGILTSIFSGLSF
jgi:pilus assembly protein TadC